MKKSETPISNAQEAVELASARRADLTTRRADLTARRGALARAVLLTGDESKRTELQQVIVELNSLGAEEEVLQQVAREAQADWEIERDQQTRAGLYGALDEAEGTLAEIEELSALAATAMARYIEAVKTVEEMGRTVQARLYRVSNNSGGVSAEPIKSDACSAICLPGAEATRASVLAQTRRRIAGLRRDLDSGLKGPKAA